MNQDKVKVQLRGISATLLMCLKGRADLSKAHSSLFYDAKAIELMEKIDYESSPTDIPFPDILFNIFSKYNFISSLFTLRAKQFDDKLKAYITKHPRASIVNIGAGLDTTFYRVDNGLIHWHDLDLPDVIDIRRQLLPEPDRATYIAKSLLDPSWCKEIEHIENGVFMIAGGVFFYFNEIQVHQFFSMIADNFPGGEIVFDAMLRSESDARSFVDMVQPEQRDTLAALWEKALREWWESSPQDQKDKINGMIAALKLPLKPMGREWTDIKTWWIQLGNKERREALMALARGGIESFAPKDANEFTTLDRRITMVDQFPLFTNIPRDSLSADLRRLMDYSDELGRSRIVHLRV